MCKSYICIYMCVWLHCKSYMHRDTHVYRIHVYIHIHTYTYIYNMCVYIHVIIYIYGVHVQCVYIYGVHVHMWPHVYIYMHVFLLVLFSVPCAKVPRAPSAWCASRSWRSGRAQFSLAISPTENGFNQPLIPWKLIVNGSLPFIPLFIASTIPWMASTLVDMN